MKSSNRKKSDGLVTVDVVHRRPGYPENVKFIRTYRAENNHELNLKTIFYEAFTEAHPDWPILEINLRNEK